MKFILIIASLVITQFTNGQDSKLQSVPGTRISLIPPNGFVKAAGFDGFQNTQLKASIMVVEMPAPIEATIAGFTGEELKKKGMVEASKEKTTHQGMDALVLKVFQYNNGTTYTKQILVFGDKKKTIMINAIYIDSTKQMEGEMAAALKSVVYNENQIGNELAAAAFTFDNKNTGLKFAKYLNGALVYSADGKIPTDSASFIAASSVSRVEIDNKKQYTIDRLKQLPRGELAEIKETNPVTIDGLVGYEIVGSKPDKNNKSTLVYFVMLYSSDNRYFLFVGDTSDQMEKGLVNFRLITNTFHRK